MALRCTEANNLNEQDMLQILRPQIIRKGHKPVVQMCR